MGIKHVRVVDPFDVKELEKVVREETEREELSVIISRRPCALIVKQPGHAVHLRHNKVQKLPYVS